MNPFHWTNPMKMHHRWGCETCCKYGIKTSGCMLPFRFTRKKEKQVRNTPWRISDFVKQIGLK